MYVSDTSGDTSRVALAGGYNVPVTGAPSPEVLELPLPDRLHIPLESRRLTFSHQLMTYYLIEFDECLISLYRQVAQQDVEPEVKELFESLVHAEERDEILLKKIRATNYF